MFESGSTFDSVFFWMDQLYGAMVLQRAVSRLFKGVQRKGIGAKVKRSWHKCKKACFKSSKKIIATKAVPKISTWQFCFGLQRYEKTRIITHRTQWNTDLMSIFSHACHAKCISAFFRVKSAFYLTPAARNDVCVLDT